MPLKLDLQLTEQLGVLVYQIDGKDTNAEANAAIANKSPGTFYIRVSATQQNCLVVQYVKSNGEIDRKLVEPVQKKPGWFRLQHQRNDQFRSLRHLIKHYSKHPIGATNAFDKTATSSGSYLPNTLAEYLVTPELVKFTHKVSKDEKANINDLGSLPCDEDGEVAVVKETAGCLLGVNKKNGLYGKLRTSRLHEDEEELKIQDDLMDLLYSPPGYSSRMKYPADAEALVDYAVPYSESTHLAFKKGDRIYVKNVDPQDGGMMLGYVKKDGAASEVQMKRFPLFAVRFVSKTTNQATRF